MLTQARAAEMNKQWEAAIDNYKSLFRLFPRNLTYGLRLASAQIEGSKVTDAHRNDRYAGQTSCSDGDGSTDRNDQS